MASRKIVTFENGRYVGRDSASETIDFLSVKIGSSGLEISEETGAFDFGAKELTNIADATADTSAVSLGQMNTALGDYIPTSEKGEASGVATLDAGGKIPAEQLPNSVMEFQGAWDASTNTPTLIDGTGNVGDVYRVSVAGTQDLGSGEQTFGVGDWAMYNGTIWQHSPASDAVASVNGQTGIVSLDSDDISEGDTNLYFTEARAKAAAVENIINAASTDVAPSGAAVDSALSAKADDSVVVKTVNGVNPVSGAVSITADDVPEGTNVYFTEARAKAAAVADSITDNVTDVAPSQNAVYDALALKADVSSVLKTKSFTNDNVGAITIRQVVYIKSNGNVDLAASNTSALADAEVGLVADASIDASSSGAITIINGAIIGGFTGLTPGKRQYIAGTAGALTETAPTNTGHFVYSVGRAVSATEIKFSPEFILENA